MVVRQELQKVIIVVFAFKLDNTQTGKQADRQTDRQTAKPRIPY